MDIKIIMELGAKLKQCDFKAHVPGYANMIHVHLWSP